MWLFEADLTMLFVFLFLFFFVLLAGVRHKIVELRAMRPQAVLHSRRTDKL